MDNELMHYGILGMKWGIRRYQNPDGSLTDEGRRRYGSDSDRQQRLRKRETRRSRVQDLKNVRNMSDEELQAKIRRLQAEKQLRELTESEIAPGKKFVNGILTDSVKGIATSALKGAGLYGLKAALSKSFDAKELGDAVFNGGPKKK